MVISGTVAVADTEAAARDLLVPEAWSMAYARTHGTSPPLPTVEAVRERVMTAKERELFEGGLRGHVAARRRRSWPSWRGW